MAGQLMLSLSILIVLHELGHFIPARFFKTRVEKFYLFFDPWFSLIKFKKGYTEYGIGWLPLGGYVKISGMIDESFDAAQMAQEPQPWEFRSKPAWQRLIIMLGGVTVNFILGFILFSMTLFVWGESYIPASQVKNGISVDSLGRDLGLLDGDQILKIGDKPFTEFNDRLVIRGIIIDNAQSIEVLRDGKVTQIPVDEKWVDILSRYENKSNFLFSARLPFEISSVSKKNNMIEFSLSIKKYFPSLYCHKNIQYSKVRVKDVELNMADFIVFDKFSTTHLNGIDFSDIVEINAITTSNKILKTKPDLTRWDILDINED